MSDQNLSQKVLDKIKKKDIKPKPRWEFLVKNYFIITLGVCSLVVGALTVAVIFYMAETKDFEFIRQSGQGIYGFIIRTLPYFWLAVFTLFITAAYYNIRLSKAGYRYRLPSIIVAVLVLSIFSGFLLHNVGAGQAIDEALSGAVPKEIYTKVFNPRLDFWSRPANGFLAGMIMEVKDKDELLIILDKDDEEWKVLIKEAMYPPYFELKAGIPIRTIGEVITDHTFKAFGVRPMGAGRGFFKHHIREHNRMREENNLPRPMR